MFKKLIKGKYNGCDNPEDYLKIRLELRDLDFSKELDFLKSKLNVFDKMILQRSKDKYIDYGNFILTMDRFDEKEHYLLIPKNISYFNILTLKESDIPMLEEMKILVKEHLGEKKLFFHCYPFNSVHTLHLHAVDPKNYSHRKNNINIDDVIYVLKNENVLALGIENIEEIYNIIRNWFSENVISLLNIYVLSLIIIKKGKKENGVNEGNGGNVGNKVKKENGENKKLIPYALDLIINFLISENKLDEKEKILEYYREEKETLEAIGNLMINISKNNLL